MWQGMGWIAGLADHDGDHSLRFVEEHAAHRGGDNELGTVGVGGMPGWWEVDAQREPEPVAGSAAGGHQHQRLTRVEPEHRRDGGEQLALVADPEHGAVLDGAVVDGEPFGGRCHAARMRGDRWAMGALLRSAVDKVRLNGLNRADVDSLRSTPGFVGGVVVVEC
jgi:hypothetical protein